MKLPSRNWFLPGLAALSCFSASALADQSPIIYDRDVRPILSENCFPCHGQDSKKRMANLRLDSFADATADRGGRKPLVPGNAEASLIYQRITADQVARRMPPKFSNRTLAADQIATIKRWIEEGGVYSTHWSFLVPKKPDVPTVSDPDWEKQPFDAFVYKRLMAEGLHPSRPAEPDVWLRRASLDLVGLPPSPTELDSFSKEVKARGEAAYVAAVDRLLASPRYGERMALDWLDVARYADTHGFNNDSSRSMWRWRDWVIQSFNVNMPYDRFITEQLAGDLLPHPTLDQRIATGFLRDGVINSEGGIIDEEYRVEYVADRVNTVSMAWMGLTVGCARCHDHKFDPIMQRDFYRLYAFFNNVPEMGEDGRVANAVPMIPAPTSDQQDQERRLESAIAALSAKIQPREKAWIWNESAAHEALQKITRKGAIPENATLHIGCESEQELGPASQTGIALADGVAGHSCVVNDVSAKPQTPGQGLPVAKRQPLTFSLWVRPDAKDIDVPLLSAMDLGENPAAVIYGRGLGLQLTGGEFEIRYADRFPAYSIRVRSVGAGLAPEQWHHLTAVYAGVVDKSAMRAQAAAVRLFVDGREMPVQVLNDDLALPEEKSDNVAMTRFRIGWDNAPHGNRFAGRMDEINVWSKALDSAEIRQTFESSAIPYALGRRNAGQASASETQWLRDVILRETDAAFSETDRKLEISSEELLALRRHFPTVMVMEELPSPRETHILLRGVYNAPGDKVDAGVPENLLGAWPKDAPRNRLGLAQWLTEPDNPLTARVVVNRFWQQLFGEGLVKTSENLGMQGDWPSHPELLDYLARHFVESGWNVKALMKEMVLSKTYRQDSSGSPELLARDPENRLLARGPRFRLPAEVIRDQALQISGLLKNHIGGPSVFPYQPEGLYKGIVVAAEYPGTKYIESTGDDLYRRSLYTFWKRTVPNPAMTVFDAPDREFCVVRRATTNTPLQALTLLNDPTFVEAARKLAERSIHEGGSTPEAHVAFAFRLATGRAPDAQETAILRKKFEEMLASFRADPKGALSLISIGSSPRDTTIPVSDLAAYTAVANMILNLDEVITKG
jgi:hypothetical protein